MIYLLLGQDRLAKNQKIDEIKSKILVSKEACRFDYEILHSLKLDPSFLKESLMALPAVATKRLVVIRGTEKLAQHNKDIILKFSQEKYTHIDLVLDVDEETNNAFFTKIKSCAKVLTFKIKKKHNVFDMTRSMESKDLIGAVRILAELYEDEIHPLQILGGLVWFWGKSKERLSGEVFKKGLLVLQEADLNIKRSRLNAEYAIEFAITKLCSIV